MGKGGGAPTTSNQTQNQNVQYTPFAQANFQDIYNRANAAASQPYSPYGGQLVSGLTSNQNQGINQIGQYAGQAQGALGASLGLTAQGYNTVNNANGQAIGASQPITGQQIQNYMNPYQQHVIDTTMANIRANNNSQQQSVLGNAAARGALGGDRVGVAQAELARQQDLASNQTIAGLEAQNYGQATQTALAEQQAGISGAATQGGLGTMMGNLAGQYGNVGLQQQAAGLQGAQAMIGAGGIQQQNQQAQLTAQYQQYLQQLAFPYQQAQFMAGIGLPASGAMGGYQTQIGNTNQVLTPPGLSFPQAAIGGTALLGGLVGGWGNQSGTGAKSGGRIYPHIPHYASGGGDDDTPRMYRGIEGAMGHSFIPKVDPINVAETHPNMNGTAPVMNIPQASQSGGLGSAASLLGAGKTLGSMGSKVGDFLGDAAADAADTAGVAGAGEIGAGAADTLGAAGMAAGEAAGTGAIAAGAAGAGEAAAGFSIADLLPLLALKRGGAAGYDDGGEVVPISEEIGANPYNLSHIQGRVPKMQQLQRPDVNFGTSSPMRQLMDMARFAATEKSLDPDTAYQLGSAMGKHYAPEGYDDGGEVYGPDAVMKDDGQVIEPEATKSNWLKDYLSDRGSAEPTEPSLHNWVAGRSEAPSVLQGAKSAWDSLNRPPDPANDPVRAGLRAIGIGGASASPPASGIPASVNPYTMPVAGNLPPQEAPSSQPAPRPVQQPAMGAPPPDPMQQQNPYAAAAAAGRQRQAAQSDPGKSSWDEIMNLRSPMYNNATAQRQTPMQMFTSPRGLAEFGARVLAANPSHGWASAVGQGALGTMGTFDKFSSDDLSAKEKAQQLASKIKEHVDKYTKMTPHEAASVDIARARLAKEKFTPVNYQDSDGNVHVGSYDSRRGVTLDENHQPVTGAKLVRRASEPREYSDQQLDAAIMKANPTKLQWQPDDLAAERARWRATLSRAPAGGGTGPAGSSAGAPLPDPGQGKRQKNMWYIGPSGKPQQWQGE